MDPLSISAAVVTATTTATKVIIILQDAKHAKKERQEWLESLKDVREYLEDLQSRLQDPNVVDKPWYRRFIKAMGVDKNMLSSPTASAGNIRPDSAFGRLDGKLKELRIKLEPQAGWWHHEYFRRGLHHFNKGDFATMFADLERLQSALDRRIQLDHVVLSEAIHADQQEAKRKDSRRAALSSLSKLDFADRQNQIFGTSFQDGSSSLGGWFFTSEEFVAWRAGRPWPLYCVGKPGAGKVDDYSMSTYWSVADARADCAFLYRRQSPAKSYHTAGQE